MMTPVLPKAALNQHVAILGKTGSGKTYTAKGIVEGLLEDRRQVCVVDPTGAWWGLRLAADGKGKGFDVVLLGGKHADVPLSPRSGAAVARLVTEQGASVVIDTSGLTVGEYTRWFIDFAGTLYTTIRNPLHLVIDEAHHFMPQGRVPDPEAGKMLHAGNRLMSGGRSKGVRGMLITQRPAKLHKDSLTCADSLIAMRVIAPQDRQAIKDWVDGAGDPVQGKEVLDSLAQLKRGEGWVWYPEGGHLERVQFPAITTYDSSATPTHGAKAGPKVREIDLGAVKASLAEAVKEAEANDPKLLRARIAELERAAKSAKPAPTVKDDKALVALRKANADLAAELEHERGVRDKVREELLSVANAMKRKGPFRPAQRPAAQSVPQADPKPRTPPPPVRSAGANGVDMPDGERTILTAIAQMGGAEGEQISVLTGYKRSTRNTYLQRLRARGYITGESPITATQEGVDALGEYEQLPTGSELREWWLVRLPEGEAKILEVLAQAYPDGVDGDRISEITGFKRSTRNTYLQRMRSKKIVDAGATPRASRELFDA